MNNLQQVICSPGCRRQAQAHPTVVQPTNTSCGLETVVRYAHHEPEAICAPRRPPRRAPGGEKNGYMCVDILKKGRLIRSPCKGHRNKHRNNLLHITAWMSASGSTLRSLRNVEDSFPYYRNFCSSLQQLAFAISHTRVLCNSCYTTAIERYHRSQKRNILLGRSSALLLCALQGHRRK